MAGREPCQLRDRAEPPLYETLSEVFDFADPELWKSNSFAALRPRLIIHVEAVVRNWSPNFGGIGTATKQPFSISASREQRQRAAEQRRTAEDAAVAEVTAKLDRARTILGLLQQQ